MWYLWDERENDGQFVCEHCNRKVNGSKYYIVSNELGNQGLMHKIGSGCIKKFTGMTIKEIKKETEEAIAKHVENHS